MPRPYKCSIKKSDFNSASNRDFLTVIDKADPKRISHGQWQKLYAILAEKRKQTGTNYWIYEGHHYCFDVTDRTWYPSVNDAGDATIRAITEAKHA